MNNNFNTIHEFLRNSIDNYLNTTLVKTPKIILNQNVVEFNYNYLKKTIHPNLLKIHYSVKANNNKAIIEKLNTLGSSFEISSLGDLDKVINANITADKLIFSNPVKIPNHIVKAYEYGVKTFAFDTKSELVKIHKNAPNSNVFIRINVSNIGSEWSLSGKFGAVISNIESLFKYACELNMCPVGISFHVGWNNKSLPTWHKALSNCIKIIEALGKEKIYLKFINIGGGFPAHKIDQYEMLNKIAKNINPILKEIKEKYNLEIFAEPGSFIVANSGVAIVKIFDIIKRNQRLWVFVDSGINQGFHWILSGLEYDIIFPKEINKRRKLIKYIVTGPTCDTHDIFSKDAYLPNNLKIDDYLLIYPAGAYIESSSEYNGFKHPETLILD